MKVKLSSIVSQYLDLYNLGKAEYARAYRIAVRGWRELNWDIVGAIKKVTLSIPANKVVPLPDDFISEVDLGETNFNGGIRSFTRTTNFNGKNYLFPDVTNVRDGLTPDYLVTDYTIGDYSLGAGSYNNVGYYYIDKNKHQIILDPESVGSEIVLKYLSYSGKDCDDHELNELATEALISFLDWQLSKVDKRISLAEKRDKERAWYNEKSKAKLRIKRLTVADLNQSARESVKMGLKS